MSKIRHSFLPKGSVILLRIGTKVINDDGSVYTVIVPYEIELSADSSEFDEYIFWSNKRCKKLNILVGWKVY